MNTRKPADYSVAASQDAEALRCQLQPEYADWRKHVGYGGTLDFAEYSVLRDMWRMLGGHWFGPNVEHGSMPEQKLLPILRELLQAAYNPQIATGAHLDALCKIPMRPSGMSDDEVRAKYYGIHGENPPRKMQLADLYAFRTFGWHQFDWPILPQDWYL